MQKTTPTKHLAGYMRIAIKDFGPISTGEITLKPLTILVGPNGCGKTHVSILIHSVIESEKRRINWDLEKKMLYERTKDWHLDDVAPNEILEKESQRIYEKHKQNVGDIDSGVSKYVADFWTKSFSDTLEQNIQQSFFNKILAGKDKFELEVMSRINHGKFKYSKNWNKLQVTKTNFTNLKIHFKNYNNSEEMEFDKKAYRNGSTVYVNIPSICSVDMIYALLKNAMEITAVPFINRSVFFPAERAGLLHYAESLIDYSKNSIKNKLQNYKGKWPRFILSWLPSIIGGNSEFATIVEQFEKRILNGSIVVTGDRTKIDIRYKQNNNERPFFISATASYIKDIAYFFVYVKYVAKKHDVIILEEPEINLHPSNQILLARLIVNLVNAGLCIVVSTHSPYFLEQLSHCVVGGTIQDKQSKAVLPRDECIKHDAVSVYRFAPDNDNGYTIQNVEVGQDGIAQTEFTAVDDTLYNELTKLRQAE